MLIGASGGCKVGRPGAGHAPLGPAAPLGRGGHAHSRRAARAARTSPRGPQGSRGGGPAWSQKAIRSAVGPARAAGGGSEGGALHATPGAQRLRRPPGAPEGSSSPRSQSLSSRSKQQGKEKRGVSITELLLVTDWRPFGKQFPKRELPIGDQKAMAHGP